MFGISLRQPEGSEQYFVVVGKNGTLFEKSPGLFDCLDGITGKHALIGRLLRRQRGLVSDHDVDEL